MNPRGRLSRCAAVVMGAALAFWGAACSNPFVAKHKVLVDSIAAAGVLKPAGQSYRLVAKKSMVSQTQAQVQVIKACIDAALSGQGMFESPPNVPPDLFIEVGYGVDTSPRIDPSRRETYLQLSARSNPLRSNDRATGEELWDVRVGVLGVAGRLEAAMPLLSAVAANFMATDTKAETRIEIPQNSPMVASVRESAIKALEAKAGVPSAPKAAPAPVNPAGPPASGGSGGGTTAGGGAPASGAAAAK